jgi:hypothetical protein
LPVRQRARPEIVCTLVKRGRFDDRGSHHPAHASIAKTESAARPDDEPWRPFRRPQHVDCWDYADGSNGSAR